MKVKSESEVAQSCPTLGDPMDCSLPGSSVHGIFQAGVLEWGAIAFSEVQATYILFLKASGCSFQRILDCVCVCMCLSLQLEPAGDQETFGSKGAFGFQHPVR